MRTLFDMAAVLIVSSVSPILLNRFGGMSSQASWTKLLFINGAICLAAILVTAILIKERKDIIAETQAEVAKEKGVVRKAFKATLTTKYFWVATGLTLIMGIHNGLSGMSIYYARDVLGNGELNGILSMALLIPVIVIQFFVPSIVKRIGKKKLVIVGSVLVIFSSLLFFIGPKTIFLVVVCFIIKGFGFAPLMGLAYSFPADVVDYVIWKKDVHAEGVAYSAMAIGIKVGIGIGAITLGWGLQVGGYVAGLVQQSARTINTEIGIMGGAYLIMGIGFLIFGFLWDFEKHLPAIVKHREANYSRSGA
jgi:GPH family glycoside/pentoside/hexuronide:cation symporter